MPTDNYESDSKYSKKKKKEKKTQRKVKKCRELTSFNRLCYNRGLYKERRVENISQREKRGLRGEVVIECGSWMSTLRLPS